MKKREIIPARSSTGAIWVRSIEDEEKEPSPKVKFCRTPGCPAIGKKLAAVTGGFREDTIWIAYEVGFRDPGNPARWVRADSIPPGLDLFFGDYCGTCWLKLHPQNRRRYRALAAKRANEAKEIKG